MKKQIVYDRWFVVETTHGTQAIPQGLIGKTLHPTHAELAPFIEGEVISVEVVDGYGARLSMPGYMDCTEWTVFDTPRAAMRFLKEMYDE